MAGLYQNLMQVRAVDDTVGKVKTLLKCLGIHWDTGDLGAAHAVAHDQSVGKHRQIADCLGQSEDLEHLEDIGAKLNAGADLTKLACLFK